MGEHELALHLLRGRIRHFRESGKVPPGSLGTSLREVGRNGRNGTQDLRAKSGILARGTFPEYRVDVQCQPTPFFPCHKPLEVSHASMVLLCAWALPINPPHPLPFQRGVRCQMSLIGF